MASESQGVPFDVIQANLQALGIDTETKFEGKRTKNVVLLSTGSYNPVHKMHVRVFDLIAEHMEKKGNIKVVGGLMSPSHDSYVRSKFRGQDFIPGTQRAALCDLACQGHRFLRACTWEIQQQRFVDFPYVARAINTLLLERFKGHCRVVYVCGSDHARKCGLSRGLGLGIGVAALLRPGSSLSSTSNMTVVNAGISVNVSSTKVRAAIREGRSIAELVPPAVSAYIAEHALLGYVPSEKKQKQFVPPGAPLSAVTEGKTSEGKKSEAKQSEAKQSEGKKRPGSKTSSKKRPKAKQEPSAMKRHIFISASRLHKEYKRVPKPVLDNALFFFGSKRMWFWPETKQQRAEAKNQPTDYTKLPARFVELVARKEAKGEVCFLKPDEFGIADVEVFGDYKKASDWLESVQDPTTGQKYKPLILDDSWWTGTYKKKKTKLSKHGAFAKRVVLNYTKGYHNYSSVMELLSQSNPSLIPVLSWSR